MQTLINHRAPEVLPVVKQITLCIHRGFLRLRHNLAVPISTIMGNLVTSIILGSMFYNMPEDTNSFFGRTVLLFFTSLVNTTLAAFEVRKLPRLDYLASVHSLTVDSPSRYGMIVPSSRSMSSLASTMPLLKPLPLSSVICLTSLSLRLFSTFLSTS